MPAAMRQSSPLCLLIVVFEMAARAEACTRAENHICWTFVSDVLLSGWDASAERIATRVPPARFHGDRWCVHGTAQLEVRNSHLWCVRTLRSVPCIMVSGSPVTCAFERGGLTMMMETEIESHGSVSIMTRQPQHKMMMMMMV